MASHARRSNVESAIICERLLKRVVDEQVNTMGNNNNDNDNNNNGNGVRLRVTTKMYTVVMDAWAKCQRRRWCILVIGGNDGCGVSELTGLARRHRLSHNLDL